MTALPLTDQRGAAKRADAAPGVAAPQDDALAASLRYVCDTEHGISRVRNGRHWCYVLPDGSRLSKPEELDRIAGIAIPPAWTDVWICPHANGHIQATGRDARGRKQYRYHARWHEIRDETKFGRLTQFAQTLPRIRARVDDDLALTGLPREKLLATVVRLLESTLIRIGNGEYARANDSFGLTTLRDRHAGVEGTRIEFRFRGKGGKEHKVGLRNRRLANIVRRCQELPGEDLFQYVNGEGEAKTISSSDVNAYLRDISGDDFTAKDFRTWGASVLASMALQQAGPAESETEAKRNVLGAIDEVASALGNTRAVCRKSYVHPAVIGAYMDGSLHEVVSECRKRKPPAGLAPEESITLCVLESGR
jgi:DNA topoisomerase-1